MQPWSHAPKHEPTAERARRDRRHDGSDEGEEHAEEVTYERWRRCSSRWHRDLQDELQDDEEHERYGDVHAGGTPRCWREDRSQRERAEDPDCAAEHRAHDEIANEHRDEQRLKDDGV